MLVPALSGLRCCRSVILRAPMPPWETSCWRRVPALSRLGEHCGGTHAPYQEISFWMLVPTLSGLRGAVQSVRGDPCTLRKSVVGGQFRQCRALRMLFSPLDGAPAP